MSLTCFFASDLHGRTDRYEKLLARITEQRPDAVFLGGDILPSGLFARAMPESARHDFIPGFLVPRFLETRERLGPVYPRVFVILGNDDPRSEEGPVLDAAARGLWEYVHFRKARFGAFDVYGYSFVPPTPFSLKDWERHDVSRYVDPGCVSPEEGWRSVPVSAEEIRHSTIAQDLERLTASDDLANAIMLFHTPPYGTALDRAGLDGRSVDHVPLDVHVGSIAVRRFIEARAPRVTLHGHVHEAPRLGGEWRERIGATVCLSAAHDGEELALVVFDPVDPNAATRILI